MDLEKLTKRRCCMTECMVSGYIVKVNNFADFFNCMSIGQAAKSVMV